MSWALLAEADAGWLGHPLVVGLLGALGALVVALVAGWVGGRAGARRVARQFRSEQGWQRRMKVYTDVLKKLNAVWEALRIAVAAAAGGAAKVDVREELIEDLDAVRTLLRDCGPVFDHYTRKELTRYVNGALRTVSVCGHLDKPEAEGFLPAVTYAATSHRVMTEVIAAHDLQIESPFLRSRRSRASHRKMILGEVLKSIDEGREHLRKAAAMTQRTTLSAMEWYGVGTSAAVMLADVHAHRTPGKLFLGRRALKAIGSFVERGGKATRHHGPHLIDLGDVPVLWWQRKRVYNGAEQGPAWLRVMLPIVDEAHHRIDWLINGLPIWQHCKAYVVPPWRALRAAWRDAWYELRKWD